MAGCEAPSGIPAETLFPSPRNVRVRVLLQGICCSESIAAYSSDAKDRSAWGHCCQRCNISFRGRIPGGYLWHSLWKY
jgi:hypothetical protein